MLFSITKAGGTRHCHECHKAIDKDSKFLLYNMQGGIYMKYENYCPKCGIKKLKTWRKAFDGMEKELDKYLSWDH